ncbi:tautomerase family protein [Motilimonas pumila]|uniref:Tautomerase family protein n=1 Tax=Motilimonas pumila TaxID=2303987 RepID=A0A418YGB9_9GAMM|nr:tautomerase family protein [Motilimonas pumila]RJG48695.1 tautomerase family protein [Motilimonas pumila]
MVIIYGQRHALTPIKGLLSDTIHHVMQQVLGLPEGKRAHRFISLDSDDFYYPSDRSERYTVIEVNMMQGRSVATKKRLIKTLFELIEQEVGIAPIDVEITLQEQPEHCWGFRGMTGDEAKLNYSIKV